MPGLSGRGGSSPCPTNEPAPAALLLSDPRRRSGRLPKVGEHLVVDPDYDFSSVADFIPASIGGPAALIGERAVEATIAAGGHVSVLAVSDSEQLLNAGGMIALLRY